MEATTRRRRPRVPPWTLPDSPEHPGPPRCRTVHPLCPGPRFLVIWGLESSRALRARSILSRALKRALATRFPGHFTGRSSGPQDAPLIAIRSRAGRLKKLPKASPSQTEIPCRIQPSNSRKCLRQSRAAPGGVQGCPGDAWGSLGQRPGVSGAASGGVRGCPGLSRALSVDSSARCLASRGPPKATRSPSKNPSIFLSIFEIILTPNGFRNLPKS